MLRHEQQSIRMALAAALHHSSGKVHAEYGGLRGLKTATRAGEEGHEDKHDALRRQKPPPPQPELFSCRKSSSSSSHCLLLPSRLSLCPRSLLRTPSRSERRSGLRSWRNSWWKCRCLPRLRHPADVVVGCAVTALGRRWLRMVPLLRAQGSPLVEVGYATHPVDSPGGTHRQPRAVYKYWARLRFGSLWTSL